MYTPLTSPPSSLSLLLYFRGHSAFTQARRDAGPRLLLLPFVPAFDSWRVTTTEAGEAEGGTAGGGGEAAPARSFSLATLLSAAAAS